MECQGQDLRFQALTSLFLSPFPDKPTAKIEPHPQYPREGEKLQLQCDGQGNPM